MALTDNLINYWKLDESSGNAADSVGSLTLTATTSPTYGAALINNGLVGNSGGYLRNSASNSSLGTATAWTINCWVWMSSTPSGVNDYFFGMCDTTNQLEYDIYYREDGALRLRGERVKHGVAAVKVESVTTLSTSTWHMLTFTFSTSQIELFLDGVSVGTTATSGTGSSGGTAGTSIGATAAGAQPIRTNVKTDEYGIWTRQLSGAEITSLYNSGAGLAYPFITNLSLNITADSTAIGESKTIVEADTINKTDSSAVGETVALSKQNYVNITTDSTAIGEVVTMRLFSNISPTADSTAIGETVTLQEVLQGIAVTDSTAISDADTINLRSFVNVNESTAIGETVTLQDVEQGVVVTDSTAVSDTPTLSMKSYISATDSTIIGESVSITESTPVTGSGYSFVVFID